MIDYGENFKKGRKPIDTVFSIAMCLAQVLTQSNRNSYSHKSGDNETTYNSILNASKECSAEKKPLFDLILKMINPDTSKRISEKEALQELNPEFLTHLTDKNDVFKKTPEHLILNNPLVAKKNERQNFLKKELQDFKNEFSTKKEKIVNFPTITKGKIKETDFYLFEENGEFFAAGLYEKEEMMKDYCGKGAFCFVYPQKIYKLNDSGEKTEL